DRRAGPAGRSAATTAARPSDRLSRSRIYRCCHLCGASTRADRSSRRAARTARREPRCPRRRDTRIRTRACGPSGGDGAVSWSASPPSLTPRAPLEDHPGHEIPSEVVGEIPPVRRFQECYVGVIAGSEPPAPVRPPEHVRGIDRAGGEGFRGREPELRRCEGADEREAFAEGAARVEVG